MWCHIWWQGVTRREERGSQPYCKKGTHAFNISWLCSVIREAGWKQMVLFSDNEPALKALKQAAVEACRDLEITLQESPTSAAQEKAAWNGTAESLVREVKRSIRAILSEIETKLNKKVDPNHNMLAWIARHAAFLIIYAIQNRRWWQERVPKGTGSRMEKANSSVWRANSFQACRCRWKKT